LGPIAINYVLYPRFSSLPPRESVADARQLLPRATIAVAAAAPIIAGATVVVLPLLYGDAFNGALVPACIIIVGLIPEGAAAVSSALLWGLGRPGTNSVAMAAGLVATVVLDILLIPHFAATGAAVASATAYVVTTAALLLLAARAGHIVDAGGSRESLPVTHPAANVESAV
jgi:O-antigen/teichoic acid export membrane protein